MTSTETLQSPPDERIPAAGMRVIWLMLIATFVTILNEMTMGIALPHLNEDLGIPPERGQWLTSAFMLTMAVVIPTTGFLIQRFSTRQLFFTAITTFIAGTVIDLVAPGFTVLLIGRLVQAAGTGMMMPLLMTTVMTVAPPSLRGRLMGRVVLVMGLPPAIGPTLSGVVVDTLGWRWLFGIVLPIAIAALLIGARFMTNLGERSHAPIDGASVVLSALAFGGIVYGLTEVGSAHGDSTSTTGVLVLIAGVLSLAVFVWRQLTLQRRDGALLDMRVFRSANFSVSVIIMTIVALSMFGTLTLLPQYLQSVAGLDSVKAGLVLLPGSLLMGLVGPGVGRIYDRWGSQVLIVPGTALMTAALFFYTTVGQTTSLLVLMVAQSVLSVGVSMAFTPLFSASLGSLRPSLFSHGSAVLNTVQQVAGAIGVALLVGIYSAALYNGAAEGIPGPEAGVNGTRSAFLIAGIIATVTVVLGFFVRKPAEEATPASAAH
ncbi:MDR family MFS transporter [Streptomyces sp. NPDC101234]|uniref:MDR family MFS transporter n=1 Tax=Streptomyces sp. NPDC101234 TaxID=3366138 RepID=UPI0038104FA4